MKDFGFWLVFIIIVLIRIIHYYITPNEFQEGNKLRISTRISEEPINFEKKQYLKVEGLKIYLPKYPRIDLGDYIILEGDVVEGSLKNPTIIKLSHSKSPIFVFRQKIISFVEKSLPRENSALLLGMSIGSQSNMPKELWEKLTYTGVAHVVVASGTNVILLSGNFILLLTEFINRKKAILIVFGIISLYTILSGLQAPIVRASIFVLSLFLGQLLGRRLHTLRLLILTALIMLLVKPFWLTDLGFILSFSATLSLFIFASLFDRKLLFVPKFFRDGLSTSLAAQVLVAPILLVSFGRINLLSPFINALVLWTTPSITIIGMMAGLLLLISERLAYFVLILSFPLTEYFFYVISLANKL